jgi:hypothetical protein
MSKQNIVKVSKLTAILLALLSFALASAFKGFPQGKLNAAAPAPARDAAVIAATEEVLKETSELRQLSVVRPVKSGTQNRNQIEKYILGNLERNSTPQELRSTELAFKRLGLVPADFELRSFLVKLLTEQVAGYYDARSGQFFLADWIDLDGQKPVMAHELTHALQDQHFDLKRFDKWPKGESDSELAFHALVEGDATLTMTHYMVRSPARALAFLRSFSSGSQGSSEQIDKAPAALRETLVFPYTQGMQWVGEIYKRSGWQGVTRAYTDLPESSEQILHPEKYLARETPVRLTLADISSRLGKGWKRTKEDVNGEWGFYLILKAFLDSEPDARNASAGWGGDRYDVYEGPDARTALVMSTAWDSERDAIEFFTAYGKRTAKRYGVDGVISRPSDGVERELFQPTSGAVLIERRGNRVLVLEGIPQRSTAELLVQTLVR